MKVARKYRVIRRSATVAAPLKVCFPGGAVEAGETYESAVVREAREELGLDVRPVRHIWTWASPDKPLTLFGWLAEAIGEKRDEYLSLLIRMPEVLRQDRQDVDEEEWSTIMDGVRKALEAFSKFREDEGAVLEAEFVQRISNIREGLDGVKALDPQRAITVKERLRKHLEENAGAENVDNNRFEQELIYYLEKFDISEEKLRLATHLDYFLQTMKEASSGRKLGFIAQEIGREINTIGSKANDAGIQKIVVQMKDELEKIKEQLLNVL